MKRTVVAVGGTGQLVLHYYVQLYLLGIVREPFKAILVDTDEPLPSLQLLHEFFDFLRYTDQENQGFGSAVPSLAVVRVERPPGKTLRAVATGGGDWGPRPHAIQAFYETATLDSDLQKGLFSRPAMSAALALERLSRKELRPETQSTVVVVGSVIGGTGGGLIAPILHTIHEAARQANVSTKIRAVFFGEWFKPAENIIPEDIARWQSNQIFVLRSIADHLEEVVHSFAVVGGPDTRLADRPPEQSLTLDNMAWPEAGSPLWEGVEGLHWLLEDNTMAKMEKFPDREIAGHREKISHTQATERLAASRSTASALVDRDVVARLAGEPMPKPVWGARLVRFMSHFWGIANEAAGGRKSTDDFPAAVQRSLNDWWRGQSGRPGLAGVFPASPGVERAKPFRIRQARWSKVPDYGHSSVLFGSYDATINRTAAALLLDALRGA